MMKLTDAVHILSGREPKYYKVKQGDLDKLQMYPTPQRMDAILLNCPARKTAKGLHARRLSEIVKNYSTPTKSDSKGSGPVGSKSQRGMAERGHLCGVVATEESGSLNPDWVELLMAWPLGWTSFESMSKEGFNYWLNNHQWKGNWESGVLRVSKNNKNKVSRSRLQAIGNGQVPIVVKAAWEFFKEAK